MKCKDCLYCIRKASFRMRGAMIIAIHENHYCLKKRRNIKLIWYDCSVDCKRFEEKQNENTP